MKVKPAQADVDQQIREGKAVKAGVVRIDPAVVRAMLRDLEGYKYVTVEDLSRAIERAARATSRNVARLQSGSGIGLPLESVRRLLLTLFVIPETQSALEFESKDEVPAGSDMRELESAIASAAKVAQAIEEHLVEHQEAPTWEHVDSLLAGLPNRPLVEKLLQEAKPDDPIFKNARGEALLKIQPPPKELVSKHQHSVTLEVDSVQDSAWTAQVKLLGWSGEAESASALRDLVGEMLPLTLDTSQERQRDTLVGAQLNRSSIEAHVSLTRAFRSKDGQRTKLHLVSLLPQPELVKGLRRRTEQMELELTSGVGGEPTA